MGVLKIVCRHLEKGEKKKEVVEKVEEAKAEETPYKGELDTTAILRDIMKKHPDISSKVVDEVCN